MPGPTPSLVKKQIVARVPSRRLARRRLLPVSEFIDHHLRTNPGVGKARAALRRVFFEQISVNKPSRRSSKLKLVGGEKQDSGGLKTIREFRAARALGTHSIFHKITLINRFHGIFGVGGLGWQDAEICYQSFLGEINGAKKVSTVDLVKRTNFAKRMKVSLQFLTTPTADTPGTTLLLHFDNKRYVFGNVSEGTQRAFVQRRLGLAKISDVFLTGIPSWHTAGGLFGLILTVADAVSLQPTKAKDQHKKNSSDEKLEGEEKRNLTVHGGKNLTHMLATARRFVFRKGLPLQVNEITDGVRKPTDTAPMWTDSNIRVWAMAISSSKYQRKRSHDEMSGEIFGSSQATTDPSPSEYETAEQLEQRNMQFLKGVIGHMFDSEWRLDSLRKLKLADVKMPAAIFVRKPGGGITEYTGPKPGDVGTLPDIDVLVRTPWPGAAVTSLPSTTPCQTAISYIVKPHKQRGKFLVEKAIEHGVPKGRAWSELTKGNNVTTKTGKVVTPEMVLEPSREGNGLAVVELPTEFHIDGLINREEWLNKEIMEGIETMVWILGKGVISDSRISAFMNKYKTTRHLVSSPDTSSNRLALESPAMAAIRLHQVDPDRFPVPIHENKAEFEPDSQVFDRARAGAVLLLEPKLEYIKNQVIPDLDTANVIRTTPEAVLKLAVEAQAEVSGPDYQRKLFDQQKNLPSKDAEVITLGTGSALPSKYRNVSATLVRVPGYGNYLFDCGENTLGQLKRVFGSELPKILRDMKVIWISHLHADHHLGTTSVIKAWNEATINDSIKKLIVASDSAMIQWLAEYSEIEDYGHGRLYTLSMDELGNVFEFPADNRLEYGISSINACHVSHCHGALAVVFHFPNGLKIAYSGDCRPSDAFIRIGQGATLLIHEATFEDELQGDAIAKKHSTTGEALEVGRKMGARRILLTHFSQRYQKIPVMDQNESDQVAIVGFDYMRCRLEDFAKLAAYRPALLKLYEIEPPEELDNLLVPQVQLAKEI